MTRLKFNDYVYDVDNRYENIPCGVFIFYARTNKELNLLKSNYNKINDCEFIYPSGKVEKKQIAFRDFRNVGYNRSGYIAQILAIMI